MKKISDKEVAPLWTAYHDGCTDEQKLDLRNRLATHYYLLVRFHAERMASTLPASVDVDDLISMGTFGLLEAIENFDPTRGFQFKTYAVDRIRGAMFDGLRKSDWVARLVRIRQKLYRRTLDGLRATLGHEPSDDEVRAKLKMSRQEYENFMSDAQEEISVLSLTDEAEGAEDEGGARMIDLIEDKSTPSPLTSSLQNDNFRWILRALPRTERAILLLYLSSGMTMAEIAEELLLTESRICQLYSRALERLREHLSRHNYLERNT